MMTFWVILVSVSLVMLSIAYYCLETRIHRLEQRLGLDDDGAAE